MNFATLALLGLVSASSVQLPSLEVNDQKLKTATDGLQAWAERDIANDQADMLESARSLMKAAATWRVAEYVNFGKTWKGMAESEVEFIDSLNINENTCNKEAATKCVQDFYMSNWDAQDHNTEEVCFGKAGCSFKFESLTPAQ